MWNEGVALRARKSQKPKFQITKISGASPGDRLKFIWRLELWFLGLYACWGFAMSE